MKDSVKMVAALVLFATAACVGLAFVYRATKPVIDQNTQKKTEDAQKQLFPNAERFEVITGAVQSGAANVSFEEIYAVKEDGRDAGLVIKSVASGFNAPIKALVGVDADGAVTGVSILENTDTPGLGAHASNPSYFVDKPAKKTFYGQFTGMGADSKIAVQKDGGDVIAITAATISSRAVSALVAEAQRAAYAYLQGGAQ